MSTMGTHCRRQAVCCTYYSLDSQQKNASKFIGKLLLVNYCSLVRICVHNTSGNIPGFSHAGNLEMQYNILVCESAKATHLNCKTNCVTDETWERWSNVPQPLLQHRWLLLAFCFYLHLLPFLEQKGIPILSSARYEAT